MALFQNRDDAGRRLADALGAYADQDPVVLALPRGGVPVAAKIAEAFRAPLDLVIVRKIGVPGQPELAMGAVVDGPEAETVRNDGVIRALRISEADFDRIREQECREIESRRKRYIGDRPRVPVAGRVAIVVDDGIATGATVRAALRAIRRQCPKTLVLAVPVGASDTLLALEEEADAVVCLSAPDDLGAIGYYYRDFGQVEDSTVIACLSRHSTGFDGIA